jgi:hypothetical protein
MMPLISIVKQEFAAAASGAEHWSAAMIALLQRQSPAHAASCVMHADWKHAHEAPASIVAELVPTGVHATAPSPLLSGVDVGASSGAVGASEAASSFGVAAGLLEELHPISTTPAPSNEAAAKPIRYREARIGKTSVEAAPYSVTSW